MSCARQSHLIVAFRWSRDDLTSALTNLGYDRRAIDKVLDPVLTDQHDGSFEQHLRAALKALSKA